MNFIFIKIVLIVIIAAIGIPIKSKNLNFTASTGLEIQPDERQKDSRASLDPLRKEPLNHYNGFNLLTPTLYRNFCDVTGFVPNFS